MCEHIHYVNQFVGVDIVKTFYNLLFAKNRFYVIIFYIIFERVFIYAI